MHHDLKNENAIYDGKVTRLIDFEWCQVGVDMEDLAIYLFNSIKGEAKDGFRFVLEGYYKNQSIGAEKINATRFLLGLYSLEYADFMVRVNPEFSVLNNGYFDRIAAMLKVDNAFF